MSSHPTSPHPVQGHEFGHGILKIPPGWKRDLINGRVVYITPSNCLLWSIDEVVGYLLSEETCKCGLDCPLFIHQVFNFDPCTCFQNSAFNDASQVISNQNLCNHKRKLIALNQFHQAEYQNNQELERMYHHENLRREGLTSITTEIMPSVTSISPVHYSLIVPQPILMSNQEQQMLLSPQIMTRFHPSIGHQTPPSFQSKKRVRKRNKSKMKTVAAMLKMKS